MKKLSRKHKIALIELALVLLIALYFFAPRPFSLAMVIVYLHLAQKLYFHFQTSTHS